MYQFFPKLPGMKANRQLCVIIPVHKPRLSAEEKTSLTACYRHLKTYDCYLVFPEGMATDQYTALHPSLILQPVPALWLSSVLEYNRMKTNVAFYRMFEGYAFMMTYELDAYIFSDDIAAHHGFEYDFIGAPIFEGYMEATPDAPFLHMLNSGFSIRNISACIKALQQLDQYKLRWKVRKFFYSNFSFLRKIASRQQLGIVFHDHLKGYYRGGPFNEDVIFTCLVPQLFPFFKTAPLNKAASFSIETKAAVLYQQQQNRLPLGCHAWAKFPAFWEKFINVQAS